MPSFSALTIYLFGATAFGAGVHTLLFSCPATPEMKANSLAAIAMGIYYPLAAYQENRAFLVATVPMRTLSAMVAVGLGGSGGLGGRRRGADRARTRVASMARKPCRGKEPRFVTRVACSGIRACCRDEAPLFHTKNTWARWRYGFYMPFQSLPGEAVATLDL